jgi:hypothetical protein
LLAAHKLEKLKEGKLRLFHNNILSLSIKSRQPVTQAAMARKDAMTTGARKNNGMPGALVPRAGMRLTLSSR